MTSRATVFCSILAFAVACRPTPTEPLRPEISATPTHIEFPATATGSASTRKIKISNLSRSPVIVSISAAGPFRAPSRLTLNPGDNKELDIDFIPTAPGPALGAVHLTPDDGHNAATEVILIGEGVDESSCPAPSGQCIEVAFDPGTASCSTRRRPDGEACFDACLTSSSCMGGVCIGDSVVCDDGINCTIDTCVPNVGCSHVADADDCREEDPCSDWECDESGCRKSPKLDGSICGRDLCSGADVCIAGECRWRPRPLPLDSECAIEDMQISGPLVCVLRKNGTVWCAGSNEMGQLGIGTTKLKYSTYPRQVVGLPPAKQISAQEVRACAVTINGEVYCWGNNAFGTYHDNTVEWHSIGMLGTGNTDTIAVAAPTKIQGLSDVISIDLDPLHACAVKSDGTVWCWGSNGTTGGGPWLGCHEGYLDPPTLFDSPTKLAWPKSSVDVASTGDSGGCILSTTGKLTCWKPSPFDCNRDSARTTPSEVTTTSALTSLLGGKGNALWHMEAADGNVWALDPGWTIHRADSGLQGPWDPVLIPNIKSTISLASGREHACAILSDHSIWCWGQNQSGELGIGMIDPSAGETKMNEPVQVANISDAERVWAGNSMTCARRSDRTIWCWGTGYSLNDWFLPDSYLPTPVPIEVSF